MTQGKKVLQTRPPTPQESLWFAYAEKLPFKSAEYLTDFADKLITLSSAAIAAYIAAVTLAGITASWHLWIPPAFFIAALLLGLYSLYPGKVSGECLDIAVIRDGFMRRLDRRQTRITLGMAAYFLGILAALAITLRS